MITEPAPLTLPTVPFVTFVTRVPNMRFMIFLVIDHRRAYLLNVGKNVGGYKLLYGYLCPCCMFELHRQAIMNAIRQAREDSRFDGKVRWCSYSSVGSMNMQNYGNEMERQYLPLDGEQFEAGDAYQLSVEALHLLIREAELQKIYR